MTAQTSALDTVLYATIAGTLSSMFIGRITQLVIGVLQLCGRYLIRLLFSQFEVNERVPPISFSIMYDNYKNVLWSSVMLSGDSISLRDGWYLIKVETTSLSNGINAGIGHENKQKRKHPSRRRRPSPSFVHVMIYSSRKPGYNDIMVIYVPRWWSCVGQPYTAEWAYKQLIQLKRNTITVTVLNSDSSSQAAPHQMVFDFPTHVVPSAWQVEVLRHLGKLTERGASRFGHGGFNSCAILISGQPGIGKSTLGLFFERQMVNAGFLSNISVGNVFPQIGSLGSGPRIRTASIVVVDEIDIIFEKEAVQVQQQAILGKAANPASLLFMDCFCRTLNRVMICTTNVPIGTLREKFARNIRTGRFNSLITVNAANSVDIVCA